MKRLKVFTLSLGIMLFSGTVLATEMAYKVSDEQVEKVLFEMNKYEQCVYPEITKANNDPKKLEEIYSKRSELEQEMVWDTLFLLQVLPDVLGKENVETLMKDDASRDYFSQRYDALNHSKPVTEQMTSAELVTCMELKRAVGTAEFLELKRKLKYKKDVK